MPLIETEEATREKVFQNLFRFTFAGDFLVEDKSTNFRCFQLFGEGREPGRSHPGHFFYFRSSTTYFAPVDLADVFVNTLLDRAEIAISNDVFEVLRIESGIPKYGVDMDETTIVPELGLQEMISYTKGCYIGQEIIARIHFRGHVAKRLIGLVASPESAGLSPGAELKSRDGKNSGKVTSVTFSPKLQKRIGLGYVRYDYLAADTVLLSGEDEVEVTPLPFI